MFVDKPLKGLNAVQTLSRLNRIASGKEATFVLDFRNDAEAIAEAFQRYYEAVIVEPTDTNILYDLRTRIMDVGILDAAEIAAAADAFFAADPDKRSLKAIYAAVDPAVERFKALDERAAGRVQRRARPVHPCVLVPVAGDAVHRPCSSNGSTCTPRPSRPACPIAGHRRPRDRQRHRAHPPPPRPDRHIDVDLERRRDRAGQAVPRRGPRRRSGRTRCSTTSAPSSRPSTSSSAPTSTNGTASKLRRSRSPSWRRRPQDLRPGQHRGELRPRVQPEVQGRHPRPRGTQPAALRAPAHQSRARRHARTRARPRDLPCAAGSARPAMMGRDR
jgi:hypothetical protein